MIKPSLLDVLKENRKVDTDEFAVAVAIKNMEGFISRPQYMEELIQLSKESQLSTEDQSQLDLMGIYFPLFARFENDELLKYIEDDIKEIINNKKNKGLI